MQTYLRNSLFVRSKEFPYKAPEYVQKAAGELRNECRKYEMKCGDMFLLPIDSEEYQKVLAFAEEYKEYWGGQMFYEHRFTKRELDEAEYLLLKCSAAPIEPIIKEQEAYSRCCCKSNMRGEQLKCYTLRKGAMKNKILAHTYDYRWIFSVEAKEAMECAGFTNIKFLPVYNTSRKELLAYQLKEDNLLPELAEINGWKIYEKCPNCNRTDWDGIQTVPHPFYMPKEWKEQLQDFNFTAERFAVGSRYCIISRRVYQLLLQLGAKKMSCEPIVFLQGTVLH